MHCPQHASPLCAVVLLHPSLCEAIPVGGVPTIPVAVVQGVSRISQVPRIPQVPGVSKISEVSGVPVVSGIARVSTPKVPAVPGISAIPAVSGLSPWTAPYRGAVAPGFSLSVVIVLSKTIINKTLLGGQEPPMRSLLADGHGPSLPSPRGKNQKHPRGTRGPGFILGGQSGSRIVALQAVGQAFHR